MMGVATYQNHRAAEVIIGVDTHKDQHVAVAIDGRGVLLDECHVPVTTNGYECPVAPRGYECDPTEAEMAVAWEKSTRSG